MNVRIMEVWGHKTIAWFDVWSIEHFVTGICIGCLVSIWMASQQNRLKLTPLAAQYFFTMAILLIAFIWEAFEFYIEADYIHPWATHWMQGVEFIGNRMITDPILVLLGGWFGRQYVTHFWVTRFFSVAWLFIHLFIFPHAMYGQEELHDYLGIEETVPRMEVVTNDSQASEKQTLS